MLLRLKTVTNMNVQWMVDGVNSKTGHNVLPNVEEETRQEIDPAQIRPQQMEELTVKEMLLRLKTATQILVKWMVDGVTLETGLNVLPNVEEAPKQDQGPAPTLLLQTEELSA